MPLNVSMTYGTYEITNSTLQDLTTNTTNSSYQLPFNQVDVAVTAFLYIFLLVLGVIGNSLTMAVLITTDALKRSIFNQFILSLCVSDLVSALFSWVNLYRRTWGFMFFDLPEILCKIYWGMHIWTCYVTSLHILSFAMLRFISLTFVKSQILNKITSFHAKIWICAIWLVTFFCGCVPSSIFVGVKVRNRTSLFVTSKWPSCTQNGIWVPTYRIYAYVFYPIFLCVPILVVAIVSVTTSIVVVRAAKKRAKVLSHTCTQKHGSKEIQAVVQLMLIVGSFLMGYLPFTLYEFITTNTNAFGTHAMTWDWRFGTYYYIFLRFSECLNPVFYNLGARKLRRDTWEFCCRLFGRKRSDSVVVTYDHSPTTSLHQAVQTRVHI